MNRAVWRGLWLCAAGFVLYGALLPFHFDARRDAITSRLARVRVNPLISPDTQTRLSIHDVVENVLLFLPFGVFGMWAAPEHRSRAARLAAVTIAGTLLSIVVEGLQLLTVDRVTATADVLINTISSFTGACAGALLAQQRTAVERRADSFLDRYPTAYPAALATLLVVLGAWEPFDFTLDVGATWSRVKALRVDLWQGGPGPEHAAAFMQFFLFGLLVACLAAQLRLWRPLVVAAGGAIAAAFLLEGAQLFIESRMPGLTDALINACGAIAGVVAASQGPRAASRPAIVALCLAILAAAAIHELGFRGTPPAALNRVSHALEQLLMYFPFGFAAACVPIAGGRKAAVGCVLAAAGLIESVRAWTTGQALISDVVIAGLGAYAGAAAAVPNRVYGYWPRSLRLRARTSSR